VECGEDTEEFFDAGDAEVKEWEEVFNLKDYRRGGGLRLKRFD
jgi:hypothetical protein